MKNIIGIFIIIAAMAFVSCEPVFKPNAFDNGLTPVTDADIAQYVKIEQQMREGKKSNFFKFTSEGLKALTAFQHGLGKSVGTGTNGQFIQCYVVPGEQEIILFVMNSDGSTIEKKYPFTVEECFDVAPEWAIICGSGEKVWSWDETRDRVWGNGASLVSSVPDWWGEPVTAMNNQMAGNGQGATMTFIASGSRLVKTRNDGIVEEGTFSFDMNIQRENVSGGIWTIGQLKTAAVTVLSGKRQNEDGTPPLFDYEFIKLTDEEMTLVWPRQLSGWGEAWYWFFRAQ